MRKPLLVFNSIGALFFSTLLICQVFIFSPYQEKMAERPLIDRSLLKKRLASCDLLDLQEMAKAGERIEYWEKILAKTKSSVLTEVFKGRKVIYGSTRYPRKTIFDRKSRGQYYYHTHRKGEHGHFHLFLWKERAASQKIQGKKDRKKSYTHLIAISMAASGEPLSFFTTNQWVTGEEWHEGEEVIKMLPLFQIEHAHPSWVVNQWLQDLLILFRPQLIDCIHERDLVLSRKLEKRALYRNNLKNRESGKETLQNLRAEQATIAQGQGASEHAGFGEKPTLSGTDSSGYFGIKELLADHNIEVLSQVEISIKEQIEVIRELLGDTLQRET